MPKAKSCAQNPARKRSRFKSLLRRAVLLLLVVILWPFVALPLYNFIDPISMPMLVRYVTLQPVQRQWRSLEDISDRLKASVLMSEDGQFCTHDGIDWLALQKTVEGLRAGKRVRGASTISMQLVKNLFLWNSRSYLRKGLEVPLALYADAILSKQRIFEIYLNIAEWGPSGQFGIEAGTQHFYGAPSQSMAWSRAALMAATLPNPLVRNPANPSTGQLNIALIIEKRARAASPHIGCIYDGPVRLK